MADNGILDGNAATAAQTVSPSSNVDENTADFAWWKAMREANTTKSPDGLIALAQETGTSMPASSRRDVQFLAKQDTPFLQALLDSNTLRQPTSQDMAFQGLASKQQRTGLEHMMAAQGRTDVVEALHRSGWDLDRHANGIEHTGRPITLAAENGHTNTMRAVFMAGANTDIGNNTLLPAAAASGDVAVFREARSYAAKADPATLDQALGVALRRTDIKVDMVEAVLEAGAKPNGLQGSVHTQHDTLAKHPVALAIGQQDKLAVLLERGSDPLASRDLGNNQKSTAVDVNGEKMDAGSLALLHAHGVATGRKEAMEQALGKSVYFATAAALEKASESVTLTKLVDDRAQRRARKAAEDKATGGLTPDVVRGAEALDITPSAFKNIRNAFRATLPKDPEQTEARTDAIFQEAQKGALAQTGQHLIRTLNTAEQLGLPIDTAKTTLWTRAHMFEKLLEQGDGEGAAWQKKLDASRAYNALSMAKEGPAIESALETYQKRPDLVNQTTLGGQQGMLAAARLGPEAIDTLRGLGGDVHAKASDGATAMHLAAGNLNTASMAHLKELGVDINARDTRGYLPASYAVGSIKEREQGKMRTFDDLAKTASTLETIAGLGGTVTDRQNASKRSPVDEMQNIQSRFVLGRNDSVDMTARLERLKDSDRLHKQESIRARLREGLAQEGPRLEPKTQHSTRRQDGAER